MTKSGDRRSAFCSVGLENLIYTLRELYQEGRLVQYRGGLFIVLDSFEADKLI